MIRALGLCAAAAATVVGFASASSGPPSATVTARVLVSPLSVALVVPSGPVKAGNAFHIEAQVFNEGSTPLANVTVSLLAPQELELRDPATQTLQTIAPGADRRAKWRACTTTPGGYVVMARAASGPFTTESAGGLVEIAPAKRASC